MSAGVNWSKRFVYLDMET